MLASLAAGVQQGFYRNGAVSMIRSVVDRFGHKRVVAAGGLFGGAGWAGFALLMRTEPNFVIGLLVPNILLGLGMAVLFGMVVGGITGAARCR